MRVRIKIRNIIVSSYNIWKENTFTFTVRDKNQNTFCYCPICKNELCSTNSFVSDTEKGVTYKCSRCRCESLWYFDTPAPFIMKHQKLTKNIITTDRYQTK